MDVQISGSPSFSHLNVQLGPNESLLTESGAMASMDHGVQLTSKAKGGFFVALMRKVFGGESFFLNTYENKGQGSKSLVLSQPLPGDIACKELKGDSLYFQPGAFICCTKGVKLQTKWAGFKSLIAGEGLFRLMATGTGKVWFGCFGAIVKKQIKGEYIVDTGHLVSYPPEIKLNLQLSGGIFSSFFSGEGFVARMEGSGEITLQTRSKGGLVGWLNPRI